MSTRWRIFLAAVALIVLPLVGLSWVLRERIAAQYTRDFARQAAGQLESAVASLHERGDRITKTLDGIAAVWQDDNQLRLAVVGGRDDLLPYLRDAAGGAMHLGGLQVLQLMDADGVILSSGHYRNEFGRADAQLPAALRQAAWPGRDRRADAAGEIRDRALAQMRLPGGEVLALIVGRPLRLAGRSFAVIGGEIIDPPMLAALAAGQADLSLVTGTGGAPADQPPGTQPAERADWPDQAALTDAAARAGHLVRSEAVPLILAPARGGQSEDSRLAVAHLVARVSTAPLRGMLRELDLTLGLALAAALAGAFGLAAWLSARLSRPLQDLAERAARVDLDDPAVELAGDRRDEVGRLARVLSAMVARLRDDARRLAAAEHRATLGEIARQVNHDLRNGLTPVRNILRHLSETASTRPDHLPEIFRDRLPTLDGSLAYLEELAGRYARLAPPTRLAVCDLGAIAREAALGEPRAEVRAAADAPLVLADPVAMRRILDNLLRNAREALRDEGGHIVVSIARGLDPDLGTQCLLSVRDDGIGMTEEVAARSCDDFFTTRPHGTGLGLSNVRRLAGDAGGRLAIASAPGSGTTVTITFPALESDA